MDAGVQALHGLTFALMHLAAMGIIARTVPDRLSGTAQTVYGTAALGIASAVMTVASGYLFGWFGIQAFWGMAALCAHRPPLGTRYQRASTNVSIFRPTIMTLSEALASPAIAADRGGRVRP